MNYTGLTDEHNEWHSQREESGCLNIYVLQQYRLNRDSNLWRSTREVAKLCEMILFLEGTKSMGEIYTVHCDHCQCDITSEIEEQYSRIRLIEEEREFSECQLYPTQELERIMNFCNLDHLKAWLMQR